MAGPLIHASRQPYTSAGVSGLLTASLIPSDRGEPPKVNAGNRYVLGFSVSLAGERRGHGLAVYVNKSRCQDVMAIFNDSNVDIRIVKKMFFMLVALNTWLSC